MPGIAEQKLYIYARLFRLINELQIPADELKSCVSRLNSQSNDDAYSSLGSSMTTCLDSAQSICKKLADWSESQLLGDSVYSENIKFQTFLVIKIISSAAVDTYVLLNKVQDCRQTKINVTLYGFILHQILLLILKFSGSERLEITSSHFHDQVIFEISGINSSTFRKIGDSALRKHIGQNAANQQDADATLTVCYDILTFYGGNLWSECSEIEGGKLYFRIPIDKNF